MAKANFKEREYKRQYAKRWRTKARAVALYGGECVHCGQRGIDSLQFHHVHKNGNLLRQHGEGKGQALYRELLSTGYRDDLEVLCSICHKHYHRHGALPAARSKRYQAGHRVELFKPKKSVLKIPIIGEVNASTGAVTFRVAGDK